MVVNTKSFRYPETEPQDVELVGLPVLYVMVDTPRDQATFQRYLALLGYIPYLLTEYNEDGHLVELWRFHHPDGPKPV